MFKTLENLNFGENVINYEKAMYNGNESTILNNGSPGKFSKLQWGVRQGWPLSAYLFILPLETLATKIRSNKNIKGIKVDNKKLNISLLSDDITLLPHDLDSVKYSVSMLKGFQHSSGLKINIEKHKLSI